MKNGSASAQGQPTFLTDHAVGQIGILVRDLDRAVTAYSLLWGLRPWRVYTHGPESLSALTYRGEPGRFVIRVALAPGSPQLELIQPLAGPSIYHEWLEERGEGLHHVAVFVPALDDAIGAMAAAGYDVLQSGHGFGLDGDGGFAYFDTLETLGVLLEAIETPARRREPESTWE